MVEREGTGAGRDDAGARSSAEQQSVLERQVNVLRDKLRAVDRQLSAATSNNTRMADMLQTAKAEIVRLKAALEHEGQPPYSYGTVVQLNRRRPAGGAAAAVTDESVDVV